MNQGAECESDRQSQVWEWHSWRREAQSKTVRRRMDHVRILRACIIFLCRKYGSRTCHLRLWLIVAANISSFFTVALKWNPARLQKVLRSSCKAELRLFCLLVCSSVPRFTSTVRSAPYKIWIRLVFPNEADSFLLTSDKNAFLRTFKRKCGATLSSKNEENQSSDLVFPCYLFIEL